MHTDDLFDLFSAMFEAVEEVTADVPVTKRGKLAAARAKFNTLRDQHTENMRVTREALADVERFRRTMLK